LVTSTTDGGHVLSVCGMVVEVLSSLL